MHALYGGMDAGDIMQSINKCDLALGRTLQEEDSNGTMGLSSDASENLRLSGEEAYARRAR